jgi:hypothetical protein
MAPDEFLNLLVVAVRKTVVSEQEISVIVNHLPPEDPAFIATSPLAKFTQAPYEPSEFSEVEPDYIVLTRNIDALVRAYDFFSELESAEELPGVLLIRA